MLYLLRGVAFTCIISVLGVIMGLIVGSLLALARTYLRAVLADGTKPNDLAAHLAGKIVIFDEATSHQDPLTQARIVDNARACGATCIFIAHRLQTLAEADDILVIENGQLIERGTYDNLLNADGAFARLARAEV